MAEKRRRLWREDGEEAGGVRLPPFEVRRTAVLDTCLWGRVFVQAGLSHIFGVLF